MQLVLPQWKYHYYKMKISMTEGEKKKKKKKKKRTVIDIVVASATTHPHSVGATGMTVIARKSTPLAKFKFCTRWFPFHFAIRVLFWISFICREWFLQSRKDSFIFFFLAPIFRFWLAALRNWLNLSKIQCLGSYCLLHLRELLDWPFVAGHWWWETTTILHFYDKKRVYISLQDMLT